ncbi:MAG: hypothetical protein NXI16_01480 [Alphaproteobacteria bacterium]|nr:hypothetical protein [Alphaproteobacteria bacterium]
MTRFYVTMTWDNWPEGGSYGTVVEAENHDQAEELCRQKMAEWRADEDQTAKEVRESHEHEWHVVDCFDLDAFIAQHSRDKAA